MAEGEGLETARAGMKSWVECSLRQSREDNAMNKTSGCHQVRLVQGLWALQFCQGVPDLVGHLPSTPFVRLALEYRVGACFSSAY